MISEENIQDATGQAHRDQFTAVLREAAALYYLAELAQDDGWFLSGLDEQAIAALPDIEYSRDDVWWFAAEAIDAAFSAMELDDN